MGNTQCRQQSYVHIDLFQRDDSAFQPLYSPDVLVHVHLEIRHPAVHGVEQLFGSHLLLPVIAHAPFRRKDALVMADFHTRAYGRLNPVLMISHDKRGRQLVGFPVLDADGGEDTAEYMRFHRLFPVDLFHLREYAHAGLCLVPVLGGEDFLHLVVKVVLFTDIHHALDDLVMVDALYRIVVNVILLVGTL